MKPLLTELVRTRDGVRLATDIYLPAGDGPFPTILQRTPYGKLDDLSTVYARWCAERGYASVAQDVRGRHDSEGTWTPYANREDVDGYDTIDWIVQKPWSDGTVACAGASYDAYTGFMAGLSGHPALRAIVARAPATGLYHHHFYCGGVFSLRRLWWCMHVDDRFTRDIDECTARMVAEEGVLMHLPVAEIGERVRWWREWLDHPAEDDFWQPLEIARQFDRLTVPVYHVGGWFDDLFVPVGPANFAAACGAHPDRSHGSQRLLMGPWSHSLNEHTEFGGEDHGPQALIELWDHEKRWLDHWVRGGGDGLGDEPPVRLFVMGERAWRSYHRWPPETTSPKELFLRAHGRLSFEAPGEEPPDHYRYDPHSPAGEPWDFGEPIAPDPLPSWPLDPSPRSDRLLYVSDPLRAPLTVIGDVVLRLHASTSATDTDWFAWAAWEEPGSGAIRLLTYGYAIRARFRNGFDRPELLQGGEVLSYEVELGATARVLPVGARLHCCIQSSCAPWFGRNLNTGGDNHYATRAVAADQTVYHDGARPSALVFTVE